MCDSVNECVIEWLRGDKTATITMPGNTRLNNKIRKSIDKTNTGDWIENKDGSIVAHVPVSWIKISPPRTVSDEQRAAASKRMKALREKQMREKGKE